DEARRGLRPALRVPAGRRLVRVRGRPLTGRARSGRPSGVSEATMRAIRLHVAGDPSSLALEELAVPTPGPDEAVVRVHAAAITRDELEWPEDRLPATPSYELSGVVATRGRGVGVVDVGEEVYALAPFDRDGAAADFVSVPAN